MGGGEGPEWSVRDALAGAEPQGPRRADRFTSEGPRVFHFCGWGPPNGRRLRLRGTARALLRCAYVIRRVGSAWGLCSDTGLWAAALVWHCIGTWAHAKCFSGEGGVGPWARCPSQWGPLLQHCTPAAQHRRTSRPTLSIVRTAGPRPPAPVEKGAAHALHRETGDSSTKRPR